MLQQQRRNVLSGVPFIPGLTSRECDGVLLLQTFQGHRHKECPEHLTVLHLLKETGMYHNIIGCTALSTCNNRADLVTKPAHHCKTDSITQL